jgi:hypothetical protein
MASNSRPTVALDLGMTEGIKTGLGRGRGEYWLARRLTAKKRASSAETLLMRLGISDFSNG